jgi:hypothetical protein
MIHVCALEIAGEDLPEVLPAINNISRQMIQPGSGRVGQVDGEEQDDETVIVYLACLARKVVVLQLDIGVSFTVIPDGIA